MKRLITLLVAGAALAGGAAGCGDDKVKEANAYVNAVNKAQTEFASASNELVGRISPDSTRSHDSAVLKQFYAAVDTFVSQLRSIKPPASVKSLHSRLTSSLVSFGDSLRAAGADLTSNNAGRILDGQSKLAVATNQVTRSINATVAKINTALKS